MKCKYKELFCFGDFKIKDCRIWALLLEHAKGFERQRGKVEMELFPK